jgi:hypothetical protein
MNKKIYSPLPLFVTLIRHIHSPKCFVRYVCLVHLASRSLFSRFHLSRYVVIVPSDNTDALILQHQGRSYMLLHLAVRVIFYILYLSNRVLSKITSYAAVNFEYLKLAILHICHQSTINDDPIW